MKREVFVYQEREHLIRDVVAFLRKSLPRSSKKGFAVQVDVGKSKEIVESD